MEGEWGSDCPGCLEVDLRVNGELEAQWKHRLDEVRKVCKNCEECTEK